jgi:predicted SAM-dependent methyltransferase
VVTHSESSFASFDFGIPNTIEFEQVDKFHFFDWTKVLEGAKFIYCVDSCLANFINQTGIGKGRRFIKKWRDIRGAEKVNRLTPILTEGWEEAKTFSFKNKNYPCYINDQNAASHIIDYALRYCRGEGIDLGGGENSFPNSKNLDAISGFKNLHEKETWKNVDKDLDYIFSSHFLEHNTNLQQVEILKNCYEHLKVNGILFLYLPHPNMDYWNPELNSAMRGELGHKHITHFDQIGQTLEEIGFELIDDENGFADHYWSYYVVAQKLENTSKVKIKTRKKKKLDICEFKKEDYPSVTALFIAYNSRPFLEASINMMKNFVDKIVVVEGAIKKAFEITGEIRSTDGTFEYLFGIVQEARGIDLVFQENPYESKMDMQNFGLRMSNTEYVWLVDTDEFYLDSDIVKIITILKEEKPDLINFHALNFFKGKDYIISGGGSKFKLNSSRISRVFRIEEGCNFISHRPPTLNINPKNVITSVITKKLNIPMYHFGYIFEDQVEFKAKLYERILPTDHGGVMNWYNNFFKKWSPRNRVNLEGKEYGVWFPDKKTITEKFKGKLPEALKGFPWDWEEKS